MLEPLCGRGTPLELLGGAEEMASSNSTSAWAGEATTTPSANANTDPFILNSRYRLHSKQQTPREQPDFALPASSTEFNHEIASDKPRTGCFGL
jgi:hypothetical protein